MINYYNFFKKNQRMNKNSKCILQKISELFDLPEKNLR